MALSRHLAVVLRQGLAYIHMYIYVYIYIYFYLFIFLFTYLFIYVCVDVTVASCLQNRSGAGPYHPRPPPARF